MLNQVPSENDDQLVLRSDQRQLMLIVGVIFLVLGIGVLIYRPEVLMLIAVVPFVGVAGYMIFVVAALKVWTFDRAAGMVRYERQPVWGGLKTTRYALSDIVDFEITSPTPLWLSLLAVLTTSPTPDPNLVMKVRQGEKIKRYVLSTNALRDELAEQMKEIRQFLIEAQHNDTAQDAML